MRIERRRFLQRAAASTGVALAGASLDAEQQFLTAAPLGDFKLFYEVHGEGPAVVFAHGSGGTHMSWWQQVPVLSRQYRCVTIDHRAFGYSKDVANGPGRRAFVQDLEGLLDRLKIERVSLVGQSMGGSTVLGFASKHPARVSALILSDTTGGYTNAEIDRLRKSLPSTRSAFAPGFAQREPALAFLYREISALTIDDAPQPAGAAQAAAPAPPPTDIRPILARKVPTLFIVGEQDVLIPPPIIEAMHRQMPGSELVKVPGAGHSVYFEKPADFNRIVTDFLGRHAHA
jgi:pimeloyl-ACP methyl ester carboxylesterase